MDEKQPDYLFFEQNREKFNEIFEFLSGPKSCFVLSGFQGTGKSKIIDRAISYINPDVLLFKYQMFEATTIDDILLNLTVDFREYHKNNKTLLPKIDTKDFRERIQYYIKNIDKPMLLILEGYENILKFEDTSKEINDFFLHIASLSKFKIIFVSRIFDTSIFEKNGLEYTKTILSSLDEDSIGEYLERYNIDSPKDAISKLITASRCYLKYIDMTIQLLQTLNISLNDLMNEYEAKKTTYSNFLINKFMAFVPEKSRELVYLLALIRQSVSKAFLTLVGQTNQNSINYLKKILILNEDKENVFIKDYFKKEIEKEIDQFSSIKIHSFLEQFYEGMLPKKPMERELMVSRNTMRREKEYHLSFVENYQLSGMRADPNLTSLKINIAKNQPQSDKNISEAADSIPENEYHSETPILDSIAKEIVLPKLEPEINPANKLVDYLELAEKYERDFDYSTAIFYYQRALEKNKERSFELKRPEILSKVAKCYLKTHNHENAIQCFNLAYDLYYQQKQFVNANKILLELALEHKESYRFYPAKNCIEKILSSHITNPPEILAKAYYILADIEDLSSNITAARDLYKKALDNAILTNNPQYISKAYFKYGLLLDDTNQQSAAIESYKKCIETSQDITVNPYLSSAYSNLAGIFYEREDVNKAVKYYHAALEADKKAQNNEGLYFVYTKLASIYQLSDKETAYKFLLTALQAAKRLNDNLYCAAAYLEIGDYYYRYGEFRQAVKSYLSARHFLNPENDAENKAKIDLRLKELQIKLGTEDFTTIVKGYKYNDEN